MGHSHPAPKSFPVWAIDFSSGVPSGAAYPRLSNDI
jgi:hypothetical protein